MARTLSLEVDRKIKETVRRLVLKRGFQAISFELVARESGVSKTALYRRWSSTAEMIFNSTIHDRKIQDPDDTGSLLGDLTALARQIVAALGSDVAKATFPGLVAELWRKRDNGHRFPTPSSVEERQFIHTVLTRAAQRGELATADGGEDLHALLLGSAIVHIYLFGNQEPVEQLADRLATGAYWALQERKTS